MEERDKRERFIHLAERRVNRSLEMIQSIGKLSNKHLYEYNQEDVTKIISALNSEISELKRKFSAGDSLPKPSFRL